MRPTLLLAVLLTLTASTSLAQERTIDSFALLTPFINDDTVLIAKYDLARLDIATVVKQWLEPLATTDAERNVIVAVVEPFDAWSRQLKANGISQFYIVSSMGLAPYSKLVFRWDDNFTARLVANTTFAVVPGASDAAIEDLHSTLQVRAKQTWPNLDANLRPDCRKIHGAAVVGTGTLLDRLNDLKPTARPEFEAALTAAENQPISAAIVPPPFFARAVTEILREPIAGTNLPLGPILANGFLWLSVGEEPSLEKFNLQVIVQSASVNAAQALATAIKNEAAKLLEHVTSDAEEARGASKAVVGTAQLLSLLPEAKADQLVLSVDGRQLAALRPIAQKVYALAMAPIWRDRSTNNMKQLVLGILNYEDNRKEMPDRAIRDKDGKPLLSWRVAILPQLEQLGLYKQFHLDEPWDSEHNRKLIEQIPDVYRSPETFDSQAGRTRYLGVVGEHCVFPPDHPIKMKEISDGTANTILIVEADPDHSVIWTKPDDLEVDLEKPVRGLAASGKSFNAAFCDGHIEVLAGTMDPKKLRALFTRDGGEAIER